MGQFKIYLEDEIESKMVETPQSAQLSMSKWIAQLIKEKVDSEWPMSVKEAAGTWDDFTSAEELSKNMGKDSEHEEF